jgi:hypothetical protein
MMKYISQVLTYVYLPSHTLTPTWRNMHNLPGIPRSHVHVPVHVHLLNLSNEWLLVNTTWLIFQLWEEQIRPTKLDFNSVNYNARIHMSLQWVHCSDPEPTCLCLYSLMLCACVFLICKIRKDTIDSVWNF